jgi:DNA (cytosine-5)-methyltransferase 1
VRYASVCDGIGAAHVAWRHLGWECAWTSEIEPFPSTVVDHHFSFKNVGDMTKITQEMLDELGPVELLVGGTPCQSFSVAGLRGGLDDPRGNLALRFVQLASVLKPEWIVWENVPGVLSSGKGRDFGTFLGALGELGYGFAYRILDAQWFGVAQRRRRVFVVAHARDWRCAAAVLFERESVFGDSPTRRKAWQEVTGSTGDGFETGGREIINALTARMGQSGGHSNDDIDGHRVIASFHPTQDPISSEDGLVHALGTGSSGGCSTAAVAFKPGQSEAAGAFFATEEFCPTLQSQNNGSTAVPAVAFNAYQRTEQEAAWPLGASDGRKVEVGVREGMAVRRLTPCECERLQGFPDDYTLVTYRNKPAADGPRYKALGNSMAVPVMRWIGERIAMVSQLKEVANVMV